MNLGSTAIVHEWVDAYAGSEQVFEAIAQLYPGAELFALSVRPGIELDLGGRTPVTTFLDRPALRDRRGLTLPLMPLAWSALKGSFDTVISSHHAFASSNRLKAPGGRHLSYVHSPARYVWSTDIDGRGSARALRLPRALLKKVDLASVQRVDEFAANSSAVAARIAEYWHRDAVIIPPPVRVEYFADERPTHPGRDYVLGVGRWIPYKNLHVVVDAADAAGLPVKIAGRGPDASRIRAAAAAASVPVEVIESPSNAELRALYQNALCLVFPTFEDFGIVPVEAQAAGTPVIAPAIGGAVDTVFGGSSGFLLESPSVGDYADAILRASSLDPADCLRSAQRFTRSAFDARVRGWVSGNGLPGL